MNIGCARISSKSMLQRSCPLAWVTRLPVAHLTAVRHDWTGGSSRRDTRPSPLSNRARLSYLRSPFATSFLQLIRWYLAQNSPVVLVIHPMSPGLLYVTCL